MIGIIGKVLVWSAFAISLIALVGYFGSTYRDNDRLYRFSNYLFGLKGILIAAASGLLIYLILNHQFQYYYVFNYTSKDLQLKYLLSAFYGGQEGSFMLWILFSAIVGLALMRWTREPYRKPVLFIMALTQVFLLSMIAGIDLGFAKIGASPFRTLAEEMPNAPFIQQNPDFVPSDGSGLNDLLKSPWMMIHPPVLFTGFALMTVPYAFAMAALWKRRYNEWVKHALPWTLGSNLCLLSAIFLGGYWAYVTLSFGGYWAWDPVENASLVPWLFGIAGIHTMMIQRKSSTSQKASIIFAILAYVAVVYETFLTRSGILADSSVHSFVDLGLYNQLLLFMLAITGIAGGLFLYRYKELPKQRNETRILTREFMTFAGAMILFLLGLVILLGTSSPILGRLFVENPTPPEISYYNEWSMPLAIIAAMLTVLGQYLFWKRYDAESLASALIYPLMITSVLTIATFIYADIRDIYYMIYLLAAYFALVGNTFVMVRLSTRNPKLIGGSLSHVGFALLLLGILGSSIYNTPLIDSKTREYNKAVEQGKVTGEDGIPVRQKVEMVELKLNEPKLINNQYLVTFEGFTLNEGPRPGQQTYKLKFSDPEGNWASFYMYPVVYPMMKGSESGKVEWSVEPDVNAGLFNDIYLYVSGSSYVESKDRQMKQEKNVKMQPVAGTDSSGTDSRTARKDNDGVVLTLAKGENSKIGDYTIRFDHYARADTSDLPENVVIGVRANIDIIDEVSGDTSTVQPLYAVVKKGNQNYSFAPPMEEEQWGLTIRFKKVNPSNGKIDLSVEGIEQKPASSEAWVLVSAEQKPLISVVWLGTFVLMLGFAVSIYRHASRDK